MKIYHAETPADYDALMIKLEEQGCEWVSGRKPTEPKDLFDNRKDVYIKLKSQVISRVDLELVNTFYQDTPIIKYKAKVDEKMRFTKKNVLEVFKHWRDTSNGATDGFYSAINNLDDTPEKVVVPKFVADYLEDCKKRNIKLVSALCPFKMGYGKEIELWFDNEDNNRLFALAWINGYEVEKEPFSWAVKGITDYFKCDGKIIVFKNEEEALEVANLIGINTEVEKMNNIDCQDCISIEELREETK